MSSVIVFLLVMGCGFRAYLSAKASGTWSNKAFFAVLLGMLALVAIVTFPLYFISPATMHSHFGLAMTSILLALGVGTIVIIIYSNRWWKRQLSRRSRKDQTLGAVILVFLWFSTAGCSAQTTNGKSDSAPPVTDARMQVLDKACKAAEFTPEECEAKRAALAGSDQNKKQGDSRDQMPPHEKMIGGGCEDTAFGCDHFDVYRARHFSLMIPRGWTVATKEGCYGPATSCPANSAEIEIKHGTSWVLVAPLSGAAKQPRDVVKIVADEDRSLYKHFKTVRNKRSDLEGSERAIGTFSGTDDKGVAVFLVVDVIVAPSGQFYVASSSVPKDENESVHAERQLIMNSIQFTEW
jgi:hypothetical protein